ncbi:MAG: BNR repeat-containing protein [Tannerellaceae bacterium]|nr:BNR repeat-containing protein [Tannerellaceae bacterium]
MKNYLSIFIVTLYSLTLNAQVLSYVSDGYSRTSVNTTVFRTNSIVTSGNTQFIAFYDAEGYMVVGKREQGNTNWQLQKSKYKGNCADAHNIISIMADGEGYLHVSFDHHNHPLNYCKSVAPFSLELGEKEEMTGLDEQDVTYPEFYKLSNGDLLFAYRSGESGRGNLVLNRYLTEEKRWIRIQDILIDGEGQRNAYWQMYVDTHDTIHLSWVWRESWLVETNHDLCYACSVDGGISWKKSDGSVYTLPITAGNAEYAWHIPQQSELINQTSMTADKNGNPYIATYWRDPDSRVPQYRLVYFDGHSWQQQQVSQRTTPFSLSGGGTKRIPISRPRLVIRNKKDTCEAFYIFRDEERGSKVSMAYAADLSAGQWNYTDLTGFTVEAWEPSHDTELWKEQGKLHIYIQHTGQGDGEATTDLPPQPIYVIEADTNR